ncbi:MAG: coproporphyrinogen III oxidase, partial [Oscillospiraceae bacterium]|nr:coproporphyrinogen III oxidase [Oscillospiraceae bacterium]
YYGIGPAAHSFVCGERRYCPKDLKGFISAPVQESIFLEQGGGKEEKAMLSLRLTGEGLSLAEYPQAAEPAEILIKSGFLKKEQDFLRLTPKGCLVSNEIIVRLLENSSM